MSTTATHEGRPIVEARQTKLGLYVTAKEAYDMWQNGRDPLRQRRGLTATRGRRPVGEVSAAPVAGHR